MARGRPEPVRATGQLATWSTCQLEKPVKLPNRQSGKLNGRTRELAALGARTRRRAALVVLNSALDAAVPRNRYAQQQRKGNGPTERRA